MKFSFFICFIFFYQLSFAQVIQNNNGANQKIVQKAEIVNIYNTPQNEDKIIKRIILTFNWLPNDNIATYTCKADLYLMKDSSIKGALYWTLVSIKQLNYNNRKYVSSQATEIVKGFCKNAPFTLNFWGTSIENDLFNIYRTDNYTIKLADNNVITGTSTGGSLNGHFEMLSPNLSSAPSNKPD